MCELPIFFIPPTLDSIYPLDPMHSYLHMDEIVRLVAHELVTSDGEVTSVALAWSPFSEKNTNRIGQNIVTKSQLNWPIHW